jgi:hypothetical protein
MQNCYHSSIRQPLIQKADDSGSWEPHLSKVTVNLNQLLLKPSPLNQCQRQLVCLKDCLTGSLPVTRILKGIAESRHDRPWISTITGTASGTLQPLGDHNQVIRSASQHQVAASPVNQRPIIKGQSNDKSCRGLINPTGHSKISGSAPISHTRDRQQTCSLYNQPQLFQWVQKGSFSLISCPLVRNHPRSRIHQPHRTLYSYNTLHALDDPAPAECLLPFGLLVFYLGRTQGHQYA